MCQAWDGYFPCFDSMIGFCYEAIVHWGTRFYAGRNLLWGKFRLIFFTQLFPNIFP